MADKIKVTARKRFFLGGRNVGPGEVEVPADKVERLVAKKLIEAPTQVGAQASATSAAPESSPASDELPEDFPSRDLLAGSRFTTLGAIREASDEDLLEISGIGDAKLKQIREASK